MRKFKAIIAITMGLCFYGSSIFAYYNPKEKPVAPTEQQVSFREACITSSNQIDQDVNNVRARLTAGGDVWWDRTRGKYVVPKVEPGQQEISSIYAGAVWLGGYEEDSENLKLACQNYGNAQGNSDFWSGPLRKLDGTTDKTICDNWDQFFVVTAEDILLHRENLAKAERGEINYTADLIPENLKKWPGDDSQYFFEANGFDLPEVEFGYKNFYDADKDNIYDPLGGDFPAIIIRGCEEDPQFPDQMIYWIYNDEGGGAIHGETGQDAIRMEVQVQAFGYATNDQINDMTFQRYRLNNRALKDLDSCYFAMWVDADLGCYDDDYVGCDTTRSLAYIYNSDAFDGSSNCTSVGVYGEDIPIIGIDYFRGPLDENRVELGMTSFTYHNNSVNGAPPYSQDPQGAQFYNSLSGRWADGTKYTFGGDGYNPGSTDYIAFAFPSTPNETGPNAWSMCSEALPFYDPRTVQASGPFTLQRGAVNELIIGAVWVPDLSYPCPDITRFQEADDIAQSLFDNCFKLPNGPDAPDVDWVELDQELIAVFTNAESSNNYKEQYEEVGIGFPAGTEDSLYHFQGYLLYQLAGPQVARADLDDPDLARLIYQVDVKDGVSKIFEWESAINPNYDPTDPSAKPFVYFPVEKVSGADAGIRHTFKITTDQFATGDTRLINHRKYYFSAVAYGYNEFEPFDIITQQGQRKSYLEGRRNIQTYVPIPRPIVDRDLNSFYGDGPIVTRLDGVGVGSNFVDMTDETRNAIMDGSFDGSIVYQEGRAPINVTVYNPLEVVDGDYEITFIDENMSNDQLDNTVNWQLKNLADGTVVLSDTSIARLNEQIFGEYGFTVTIGQTDDVGECSNAADGGIGAEVVYAASDRPFWLSGIPNGFTIPEIPFVNIIFQFAAYRTGDDDPEWSCHHEVLGTMGPGTFIPYQIARVAEPTPGAVPYFVTPAWRNYGGGQGALVQNDEENLTELNNVDIVFTNDKSKWSRCVVIETTPPEFFNGGPAQSAGTVVDENGENLTTVNDFGDTGEFLAGRNILHFDLRGQRSVSKEADPNDPNKAVVENVNDSEGDPQIGMGWFPGYAIDVESGKRLNIFFGENSTYRPEHGFNSAYNSGAKGGDMIFNPTSQVLMNPTFPQLNEFNPFTYTLGGQHYVYVTNEEYDGCVYQYERLHPRQPTALRKVNALKNVTWTGIPILATGTELLSYAEGLIPNEVIYKLRVDNPYEVEVGTNVANGYPTYQFSLEGKQHTVLDEAGEENALDMINVVPNPYYAYSQYEDSRVSTTVKITNLPAKCVITIYSLDGKFIRQYNRAETPRSPKGDAIPGVQIVPDLEWDLKNSKGIPVAAGIYLIHVKSDLGERTLKWFGINRKFDPSGL